MGRPITRLPAPGSTITIVERGNPPQHYCFAVVVRDLRLAERQLFEVLLLRPSVLNFVPCRPGYAADAHWNEALVPHIDDVRPDDGPLAWQAVRDEAVNDEAIA